MPILNHENDAGNNTQSKLLARKYYELEKGTLKSLEYIQQGRQFSQNRGNNSHYKSRNCFEQEEQQSLQITRSFRTRATVLTLNQAIILNTITLIQSFAFGG
jgi:hypothetical protein